MFLIMVLVSSTSVSGWYRTVTRWSTPWSGRHKCCVDDVLKCAHRRWNES